MKKTPVVGDTVHYFKRVTPHAGPAVGGELQTHAAMIIRVRAEEDGVDLEVTDWDGAKHIVRRVRQHDHEREPEGRWDWRRP